MIKYKTTLGDKATNTKARMQRDAAFKPLLKGMKCNDCKGVDTIISFQKGDYGSLYPKIDACCSKFENRIKIKLGLY